MDIPYNPKDWRTAFQRLEGAYSPATMRSYFTDVEAFETWCVATGHTLFPASTETVCAFLEDQGRDKGHVHFRIMDEANSVNARGDVLSDKEQQQARLR